MIKQKINKWNAWLHRNLFWVVLCFVFWITILIGLVGYGIWLRDSQRKVIQNKTERLSTNQQKAIQEAKKLIFHHEKINNHFPADVHRGLCHAKAETKGKNENRN